MLPDEGRLLSTSWAVIGGLIYNFLPFMVLPLYVSLEKIDPRLIEAAGDLYSSSWRGFRKVVVPLSLPGVLAGSLLVFIPAAGDFVNAQYLGGTQNTMIGNVIQKQFLVVKDYPAAAALSFVLMAIILVARARLHPGPGHGRPRVTTLDRRPPSRRPPRRRAGPAPPPNKAAAPLGRPGAPRRSRGLVLVYLFVPIAVIVAVLVQRARRQVQPDVEGLHARQLARPVQVRPAHRRPGDQPAGGGRVDRHRGRARHARGRGAGAPAVPGRRRDRHVPGAAADRARGRHGRLAAHAVHRLRLEPRASSPSSSPTSCSRSASWP